MSSRTKRSIIQLNSQIGKRKLFNSNWICVNLIVLVLSSKEVPHLQCRIKVGVIAKHTLDRKTFLAEQT